ncbi:hypothetical protein TSO352_04375 [Azospirillum sp. TSO35-2]|nr:hypothetical protein TSO352_04375 [Azospirillum sp. TSO35-2]
MAVGPASDDAHHRDATARLHNAGVALLRHDEPMRAAGIFKALVALVPDQEPSRQAYQAALTRIHAQAFGCVASGQPRDALRRYAALLAIAPAAPSIRQGFAGLTARILADIPQFVQKRGMAEARRLVEAVLEIEPAHGRALMSEAALVLQADRVGGWTRALRLARRVAVLDPQNNALIQQLRHWCLEAAECALARIGEGDHGAAAAILDAIIVATPDRHAAAHLQALRADARTGAGSANTAVEVLRWLAARHREGERYRDATDCLERARQLSPDVAILAELADALRHRTVQDATAAAWTYAQLVIQGRPAPAGPAEPFHTLSRCAEALIASENIDHAARTRCWATLLGARALVGYTEAFGQNPLNPPAAPNPFLVPAAPRQTQGRRRVFDGFTFFDEVELLEIRLHELHPVVEAFIVVEATHTHTGAPKPLVFQQCRERFAAYADRIVHVVTDLGAGSGEPAFAWQREARQREAILGGLTGCRDDDLIIVSDLDEILRRSVVERLREGEAAVDGVLRPELELFFHRLNRRARRTWLGAAVAPYRIVRRLGTNLMRYLAKQQVGHVIPDAGWHFTWMGGATRVLAKAEAYAHEENRTGMVLALTRDGTLPHGAPGVGEPCDIVPVDDRFPALVRAEADRLRAMGWIA